MPDQLLIPWTIRLALAAFLACLVGWSTRARWASSWQGRLVWTVGVIAFLAHILAAFEYKLHWSQTAALAHTADGTEEVMGIRFGEGIYFSYFFALLWAADVAWWWISPASYLGRPTWVGKLIIGYLVFIAFHGAIVFESGPMHIIRIVGIIGCLAMLGLLGRRWMLSRKALAHHESSSSAEAATP